MKLLAKKTGKQDRERKVLFGLISHYLKTGKPVGSHTLQEEGFADLSSATIRNYFAHLESEGYLLQQHSSGGRIPSEKAFKLYANACLESAQPEGRNFENLRAIETRELAVFLQHAAEQLSSTTNTPVFLSPPRFEQDFIISIKLVGIDTLRCLAVLVTDFGEIKTEVIYPPQKLNSFTIKRLEGYFNWRLQGQNKPDHLTPEEEELAKTLYNELMVRYIVNYSNFASEEIYRTGFSTLLSYPEFREAAHLANSLTLFENTHGIHLLLKECCKFDTLKFWIGEDLKGHATHTPQDCAIIAIPYRVNKQPVGAIGILGPLRLPYPTLFNTLLEFSNSISEALTRNLYKFKIHLQQPKQEKIDQQNLYLIGEANRRLLIEDKSSRHPKGEVPTL